MRDSKFTRQMALFTRLQALGFTLDECQQLRRIEMTLHRWAEQECGDSNAHASWKIERDETTGKPFRCVYPHDRNGKGHREAIADRETGALRKLAYIIDDRNIRARKALLAGTPLAEIGVGFYHQTDPRGCALYLIPASVLPKGATLDSCYTNGVAVTC